MHTAAHAHPSSHKNSKMVMMKKYLCRRLPLVLLMSTLLLYMINSQLTSWFVINGSSKASNITSQLTKKGDKIPDSSFHSSKDGDLRKDHKHHTLMDASPSSSSALTRMASPLLSDDTKDGADTLKIDSTSSLSSSSSSSKNVSLVHVSQNKTKERELKTKKVKEETMDSFPWFVDETWRNPDEVHHVVFVKVHKAASTTVFNVFIRFAVSRGLNVMFPEASHIISQKEPGLGALAPHPKSPPFLFDILCNHVVFNHTLLKPYFPADTKYVGIVRDPWEQIKSAYHYYTTVYHPPYLRNTSSFEQFILHQGQFEPKNPLYSYTNNRMSLDLGLPPHDVINASDVTPFLRQLDEELDLMLIADRFDESMVLLRRTFRWTMKDVAFLKLNSLKANQKDHYQPDPELKRNFEQTAKFDVAVYQHFSKVFDQKIVAEGKDFSEELDIFLEVEQQLSDFCKNASRPESLTIPKNKWSKEFSIWSRECGILTVPEITLNSAARKQQVKKLYQNVTKTFERE